ncbi:hypothetical protein [Sphaerisporangium perillae]|uniref:hypothetical protein n=1 Tax=Sphaerisporangium perillae TaxID=2935860 RepID=UPI00200FA28B|nr:hypothetical protein [Sphaerisporangium perillae]
MAIPDPAVERVKLARAGREWFADVMLTSLLLGHRPRRFNTPYKLSPRGRHLLSLLDPAADDIDGDPGVYWEFKLNALQPGQENRWPDLAFHWPDRLLIVELKTEAGSVRERQVDEYIQLGLHHYPDIRVDFLYITRDRVPRPPSDLPERTNYSTTTWEHVAQAIHTAWGSLDGDGGLHASQFVEWIQVELMAGKPWKTDVPMTPPPSVEAPSDADALSEAMRIAELVQADRKQRALPYEFTSKSEAEDFRSALREELVHRAANGDDAVTNVRPWVWTTASSGEALSEGGHASGVEVRLSYYRAPIT